jgi:hypothetical protein
MGRFERLFDLFCSALLGLFVGWFLGLVFGLYSHV